MDREKLITIAIGLTVGILAAASYFAITQYLPQLKDLQNKVTFTPTVTNAPKATSPQPTTPLSLELNQPENFSSTTQSPIEISGRTLPGAKLVVFANNDEKIASASADGTFSIPLKLEDGENQISVTAIDSQNNLVVVKRSVTLEITQ